MIFLSLILLLTPGCIALVFNGYDFREKNPGRLISRYLIFDFLTIAIAYGVITVMKGRIPIDFTGAVDFVGYSILHSNFVCKIALLFFVIAAVLGILERRYHEKLRKLLLALWGDSAPARTPHGKGSDKNSPK